VRLKLGCNIPPEYRRLTRAASSGCIGPGLSALRPDVAGKDIKGSLQLQRVMGALGIEPSEPAQQALIELRQVVEQQLLVNIKELVLDGTIEALAVRVHFWGAREGMPVDDSGGFQGAVEVSSELLTVVREHPTHGSGEEQLV